MKLSWSLLIWACLTGLALGALIGQLVFWLFVSERRKR